MKNSISYNEINSSYRNFHIWNNLGPAKTSIINGVIYAYFPSNGRLFSFSLTNTDFHEYSVPWHAWIGSNHPNEGGTWVNNSGNTPVEPHFPCTVAFIPHPNISKIIMIGMHYNFPDGLYFQGELYMAGNKFSPAFAPENPYDDQIKFLNSVGELSALTEIIEKFQNNPKTNP